jgi:predicted amidohydrolase
VTIATCQFDISGEVHRILGQTLRQIEKAKLMKAEIVHIPECSLTGYAGLDIPEILYEDYSEVVAAIDEVKKAAKTIISM